MDDAILATLDDGRRISIPVPPEHKDKVLAALLRNAVVPQEGRVITAADMAKAARAVLTSKRVSDEVMQERMKICLGCEYRKTTPSGQDYCGICNCNVAQDSKVIFNLAALEENLPNHGCKHPGRKPGGWLR